MAYNGKPSITVDDLITNNGFWHDLQILRYLNNYHISDKFPNETIETSLKQAVIDVNAQLQLVQEAIVNLGYTTLALYAAANSKQIGGEEITVFKYEAAVFFAAKAYLIKEVPTLQQRDIAENKALTSDDSFNDAMEKSYAAHRYFYDRFLTDEETGESPSIGGVSFELI